jgi:MFS family permease
MRNKTENNKGVLSWLKGPFSALLLVNFTGSLGFSIVLPFLVFLVHKWRGNALVYGVVGAAYSAFQLIDAPVLGRWSDRFGHKKILFLSQLGTVVSLTSKTAGENQGAVQGLAGSVGAAASIGLILGGITYTFLSGWLFVLSGVLIFAVVFLSQWLPGGK